jgi:hypothetical protein
MLLGVDDCTRRCDMSLTAAEDNGLLSRVRQEARSLMDLCGVRAKVKRNNASDVSFSN